MMFLTMMLLSDPSFAATDAKRYPGLMCRRLDTTDDTRIFYGQLFNDSSSSIDVECPVVRDVTSTVYSSYIYVFDSSSLASVTCALYSHSSATASFYWTGTVSTSSGGYSSFATKLTTGAMSTTFSTDSYYFWCNLPGTNKGDSGIGWYYVEET